MNNERQTILSTERTNFSETADFYREEEKAYEKLCVKALLTGSGFAVVLLTKALFDPTYIGYATRFIVPCMIVFVLIVALTFFACLCFAETNTFASRYQRCSGNKQNKQIAIRDLLKIVHNEEQKHQALIEVKRLRKEIMEMGEEISKNEKLEARWELFGGL